MPKVKYKTTKDDFQVFKRECWKWIEFFGLKSYEWDIRHGDAGGNRAMYDITYKARYVMVSLGTEFGVVPDKGEIRRCAFHEICHILISGLSEMAYTTFSDTRVERHEHEIIQILENTVFK